MKKSSTANKFSPQNLLKIAKRRSLFLVIPVVLLAPTAYFYAHGLPTKYRAKALVGSESLLPGQLPGGNHIDPATINAQDTLRTIRETVFSRGVVETIAKEFPAENISKKPMLETDDTRTRLQLCPREFLTLCEKFMFQVEGPTAFDIGFESEDADNAAKVSNRLAGLFVDRTSNMKEQVVEQTTSAVDSEVGLLRNQLAAAEGNLVSYKARTSQESPEMMQSNLKQMEMLHQEAQSKTDLITEAEARRQSIVEEMQSLEKQGVLKEEPAAKTPQQIALDELRLKLNQLRTKYTPEHPEIVRTQQEIRALEASAAAPSAPVSHQATPGQIRYYGLQAELKSVDSRLASYRAQAGMPAIQAKEYERRVASAPASEANISSRQQDATMLRVRYEALLAKQQEARMSQRTETAKSGFGFKVLEPAQPPMIPYSPHRFRILLGGIAAGLALGIGLVFAAEKLESTFESAEDVEDFSKLHVLSSIPSIGDAVAKRPDTRIKAAVRRLDYQAPASTFTEEQMGSFKTHRLEVLTDPQSVASQQYGILGLKVAKWMRDTGGKTLAITSSTGAEGKSLTALNLSLALAASIEGKVLLIDCDLRLPQVHERLGMEPGKGLSDLLAGTDSDTSAYISRVDKLDVIGSGLTPVNPINVLASARTRDVLARLKQDYQIIILDSPPVVPIADSHIIAELADGVLMVVRARQTRTQLFQHAIESLGAKNVMGVVLNDVEYSSSPYAYAYRYYQHHYLGRS